MNYIVNIDYEKQLFSNAIQLVSSEMNRELEYLYFWLGSEEPLFTQKSYSKKYLEFIQKFTKKNTRTVERISDESLIPWWGDFTNIELRKMQNAKSSVWKALEKYNLLPKNSILLAKYPEEMKAGYIYKGNTGFSGKGIIKGDLQKILKLDLPIIEEPFLKRTIDFSYLNNAEGGRFIENIVDNNFQYIGTKLYPEISVPEAFIKKFQQTILPVLVQELQLQPHEEWSIDTFLYQEEGQLKLYPASEVNYRKTMGQIALGLRKKFFSDFPYFELHFRKQKDKYACKSNLSKNGGWVVLSPEDTRFQIYLLFGFSRLDLIKFKAELS